MHTFLTSFIDRFSGHTIILVLVAFPHTLVLFFHVYCVCVCYLYHTTLHCTIFVSVRWYVIHEVYAHVILEFLCLFDSKARGKWM